MHHVEFKHILPHLYYVTKPSLYGHDYCCQDGRQLTLLLVGKRSLKYWVQPNSLKVSEFLFKLLVKVFLLGSRTFKSILEL